LENELDAVERLDATARVAATMANEPADKVDLKFGVHGGSHSESLEVDNLNEDSAGDKIMPYDRLRGRR
jgi:negative regulator of sigma E activity